MQHARLGRIVSCTDESTPANQKRLLKKKVNIPRLTSKQLSYLLHADVLVAGSWEGVRL